jgi:hypothetical protein
MRFVGVRLLAHHAMYLPGRSERCREPGWEPKRMFKVATGKGQDHVEPSTEGLHRRRAVTLAADSSWRLALGQDLPVTAVRASITASQGQRENRVSEAAEPIALWSTFVTGDRQAMR